jgi:hypothetical protein
MVRGFRAHLQFFTEPDAFLNELYFQLTLLGTGDLRIARHCLLKSQLKYRGVLTILSTLS